MKNSQPRYFDKKNLASKSYRHDGWHCRGYLPHFDDIDVTQFITIRLADSLPAHVLEQLKEKAQTVKNRDEKLKTIKTIERIMDKNLGACHLQHDHIAKIIINSLYHFHKKRYELHAFVIMPNHIHFLITAYEGFPISRIVRSLKIFTARRANQLIKKSGSFWAQDYFDQFIRDEAHYLKVINYIEQNPVAAGLCREPQDWAYNHLHFDPVN